MLQVQGISASYHKVTALKDVTLSVNHGECVGVLGPNGAGKTTLLKAIMGLVTRTGTITLDGATIGTNTETLAAAGLIMVQETRGIFGALTVQENLDLGAWRAGSSAERARRRDEAFTLFPRLKERTSQAAGSLSGGEQQMLAIGRALMAKPRLLMLDEPSLGLAPRMAAEILGAIGALNRAGLAVLLIEQRAPLALQLVKRVYMLSLGRVVAEVAADQIGSHHDLAPYYLA